MSTKSATTSSVWRSPAAIFATALLLTGLWLAGATFFMLEAWARRGMEKPWWMGLGSAGALLGWAVPLGLMILGALKWSRLQRSI